MLRIRENHSSKFLKPLVNAFGTTFLKELNSLTNFAVGYPVSQSILEMGIGDLFYLRAKKYKIGCLLFIVFDVNGPYNVSKDFYIDVNKGKSKFKDFLLFIRKAAIYEDDYWYGKGKHCIVFNIQKFEHAYKMFLQSRFSEMYSLDQLKNLSVPPEFIHKGKKTPNYIYAILTKSNEEICSKYLAKQIYEYFGTNTRVENPTEFSIPWVTSQEIFNYQYVEDWEKEEINKMKKKDYEPEINSKTRVTSKVF